MWTPQSTPPSQHRESVMKPDLLTRLMCLLFGHRLMLSFRTETGYACRHCGATMNAGERDE